MRCGYCGRNLSNLTSRSRGYGPKCYSKKSKRNSVSIFYNTSKDFINDIDKIVQLSNSNGAVPKHIYSERSPA